MRGVASIGVLEEIARVMAATSRGVAGIWVGRAVKGVMFWRFRVTASWERARALSSLIPSWRALCFATFVVKIEDPRLAAYLEETVHPLPTAEEVAVGLRAFFVQFWGSSPLPLKWIGVFIIRSGETKLL